MSIFLHKIKHKLWENYKYNPPIKYKKIKFFSNIEHSFNKIFNNKKKKIIEFEQILLLTGNSLDYQFMINEKHKLIERLIKDDIKVLISPTDIAKRNAMYYLDNNATIAKKIKVLYPSINLEKFEKYNIKKNINNAKINLLFIGQKFYGKGVPICFEIAKKLKKKKIDFHFKLVCGDVPKNTNIPTDIELIDTKISDDEKYKLYNWCHLFVFPVVQDSFGVYLECLETKTPIISSDIYDKSNIIINNKTGKLIKTPFELYEYENFGYKWKNWVEFQELFKTYFTDGLFDQLISQFSNTIEFFINNPKYYDNMRNNIYDDVLARFHPNIKMNKLINLYNENV
jgi:glycosyltransferase involved in cell wall biosynthesis